MNMEYKFTAEELNKKLDRLIEILCKDEEIDIAKYDLANKNLQEKKMIFRGLSNMRKPMPLSNEFMNLQNEILTFDKQQKTLVDVNDFKYYSNMAIFEGDITTIKADAIVNAGNAGMLGSFVPCDSSIDNVIMSAGGLQIRQELNFQMQKQGHPEPNGKAKITKGYNLPAKYIIHTVGPICYDKPSYRDKIDLINCYKSCLDLALEKGLSNIVFCSISTGVYKFPRELASKIAVTTVFDWLKEKDFPLNVVFCVFSDYDHKLYENQFIEQEIKEDKW